MGITYMLNIFELTMVISIDHQSTTNNRLSPVMTTALVNTHTDQSIANLDSSHRNQISIEDNIVGKPTRTSVPRVKSHKPKGVPVNYVTILQDWMHQFLVCQLFNILWTCHQVAEAKGPVGLCANIPDSMSVSGYGSRCIVPYLGLQLWFRIWRHFLTYLVCSS